MKDKPLFIASIFFLFLFLLAVLGMFSPLKSVFSPFIALLAVCYFLSRPIARLEKWGVKRGIAALLVYAIIFSVSGFLAVYALPKAYSAGVEIYAMLEALAENFGIRLEPDLIFSRAGMIFETGIGVVKGVAAAFVGIAAAFYILADSDCVKKSLKELIPEGFLPSFRVLYDDVKYSLNSFFHGQLVIAAVLFLLEGGLLFALRVPYAWVLGMVGAVLDIVPYLGAFVAFFLIMSVAFMSVPEKLIWVAIGFLLIQQLENNVISPKISSGSCSLHPASVILMLYIGSFGGFWGILFAVPLGCILKRIMQRIVQSLV